MTLQYQPNQKILNSVCVSSTLERELLLKLLDSMSAGVGLLGNRFELLYCNDAFCELLASDKGTELGSKVYLGRGLQNSLLRRIVRSLRIESHWQGLCPDIGPGLGVSVSNLSPSDSASNARYLVQISDQSELVKKQSELSRLETQVARAEKEKSGLVSQISHELRTPLNAVLGFAQLLQLGPELSEDQADYVNEIMSASNYLLKLIGDVLSLSKKEHEFGKIELLSENIDIEPLVEECLGLVAPLAATANINLFQTGIDSTLHIDRLRLKQVLLNLVSNAIKYNYSGGRVVIKFFPLSEDEFRVEVQDSGRGIPENLLKTIFNPFERLGLEHGQIEGTGIGLMITRRLVKLLGGTTNVISDPGYGSIFSIDLPRKLPLALEGLNSNKPAISGECKKVIWFGNSSGRSEFAARLTSLRPACEFSQLDYKGSGASIFSQQAPALIFIEDTYLPKLIESELSMNDIRLQQSALVVVRTNEILSFDRELDGINHIGDLPAAFNGIEYLEFVDHQDFPL